MEEVLGYILIDVLGGSFLENCKMVRRRVTLMRELKKKISSSSKFLVDHDVLIEYRKIWAPGVNQPPLWC